MWWRPVSLAARQIDSFSADRSRILVRGMLSSELLRPSFVIRVLTLLHVCRNTFSLCVAAKEQFRT